MLTFEFARALFRLDAKTPLPAPLFQLPPRIRHRIRPTPYENGYLLSERKYPPSRQPISLL